MQTTEKFSVTLPQGVITCDRKDTMEKIAKTLKSMGVKRVHARNIRRIGLPDSAALRFAAKSADELCRKFPIRANGAIAISEAKYGDMDN